MELPPIVQALDLNHTTTSVNGLCMYGVFDVGAERD
jgi:hypothetical protein